MPVEPEWLLTPQRVAVHLPTRTAVVADLHLGYAEARRRRGEAVPSESVRDILEPIQQVRRQHAVVGLIVAGDLLEDGECHEALAEFLHWLDQGDINLLAIVPGNHDVGLIVPPAARSRLPLYRQGFVLDAWRVVHGEGKLPDGRVVHGHDHPCLRWSPKSRAPRSRFVRGRGARFDIDTPCYLSGPQRLILPAFSKEAAGVNVVSVRRWGSLHCQVVSDNRVLDVGEVSTLRHRLKNALLSPALEMRRFGERGASAP